MPNPDKPWDQVYMPFLLAIVATAVGSFSTYNFFVLAVFLAVAAVYILRRYDARILVGLGLLLLFLGMVQQLLKQPGNATKAGDVAFYFLATGLTCEAFWHLWEPMRVAGTLGRIGQFWRRR